MLIKNVIGNLESFEVGDRTIDYVDVHWNECGRFLKRSTRAGRSVRVILPDGQTFGHNDILFDDDGGVGVVNVIPCNVMIAHSNGAAALARLALEFGNLHLPVEIESEALIVVQSPEVTALLEQLKIDWSNENRRFKPAAILSLQKLEKSSDFRAIMRTESNQPRSSDTSDCAATTTA